MTMKTSRLLAMLALLPLGVLIAAGCTSKEPEADTKAATPVSGKPVATQPGAVTPTAEQEAAKQRGKAMGAAVQAANQAAQKAQ